MKRFIALADDYDYRWNVNGGGNKGNEVHLDTNLGGNCEFRFDFVEREGGVASESKGRNPSRICPVAFLGTVDSSM